MERNARNRRWDKAARFSYIVSKAEWQCHWHNLKPLCWVQTWSRIARNTIALFSFLDSFLFFYWLRGVALNLLFTLINVIVISLSLLWLLWLHSISLCAMNTSIILYLSLSHYEMITFFYFSILHYPITLTPSTSLPGCFNNGGTQVLLYTKIPCMTFHYKQFMIRKMSIVSWVYETVTVEYSCRWGLSSNVTSVVGVRDSRDRNI